MKSSELLEEILSMRCFAAAIEEAKAADPVNGGSLEAALHACLAPVHEDLRAHRNAPKMLRMVLYREAAELKAHSAAYLSYERELGNRQVALWRFALNATDSFFRLVFDALDEFFDAKARLIVKEVEQNSGWYTGLADTAKKGGVLVNRGLKAAKEVAGYLEKHAPSPCAAGLAAHNRFGWRVVRAAQSAACGAARSIRELPDEAVKTQGVVQRAMEKHLGREVLSEGVRKILEEAVRRYEQAWRDEIKAQTPDLSALKAFSPNSSSVAHAFPVFDVGVAEQALAVGLGGAALGTMSLAAGWHTMAYAMVHVFYPAAIAVAIAAAGIAWLRKDQDLEKRRERVRDAVDQYHRYFLLEIDTGKRKELGGVSLRDALGQQARQLVEDTVRAWERAISGNLTTYHYRRLGEAAANHLLLVQQCVEALEAPQAHQGAPGSTTPMSLRP